MSRSTSQKFDMNTAKPSKWFPNANLCGNESLWKEYADFHASVLSGKQKGKYLIYECKNGNVWWLWKSNTWHHCSVDICNAH